MFRPADWPETCPLGHELVPGSAHYGGWWPCDEPCGGPAGGHHRVYCGVCSSSLRLGHDGAEWDVDPRPRFRYR